MDVAAVGAVARFVSERGPGEIAMGPATEALWHCRLGEPASPARRVTRRPDWKRGGSDGSIR
jgi:hypothetical protein